MLRALFLLLFIPWSSTAQQVLLQDGKLLYGDKLYALYEAAGEKKPNLINTNAGMYENNPESNPAGFKDYVFSTPTGDQLIFATAKVVASPYNSFVKYFYSIRFSTNDEVMSVQYHPLTIECLAKDIVKYHIIKNGQADNEALLKLITAWKKNKILIDDRILSIGSIRYYNNSPYHLEDVNKYIVKVNDHNIYYKDSLVATYNLSKKLASTLPGTSKDDFYYYINYPDGKPFAEIQFQIYYSCLYVWPSPLKDPFKVYTAERGEENIIKAACTFLLNRGQNLAQANNK